VLCAYFSAFALSAPAWSADLRLNSANCMGCHTEQTEAWKQSDHAMSMAVSDSANVLGDFNQQKAYYAAQTALFFTEQGRYKATITDTADNSSESFDIAYTFGHYPLQQYLVETKPGTFQVLPFAWDARPAEEGGQQWFHNYAQDTVTSKDRLHWRQPLQNWNGICADCHSDELKRNYNPLTNSFDTQFTGINVGCVSCHGVMDNHAADIQSKGEDSLASGHHLQTKNSPTKNSQTSTLAKQTQNALGNWVLEPNANTAVWKGPARDNAFMDTCYACHSLRAPLTDGFTTEDKFLDQFSPSLILPPLYHADGKIKEEVFVYGSFLQSKMYANGVNCLDCHDLHTMKVKVEGNGLCLQCHKASEFDTPTHHQHTAFSPGAQCVNCHMPDETYMGVDDRRDHSFKVPTPHLSDTFDTPNACTDCHEDKNNRWAAQAIEQWYGKPAALTKTKQNLLRLRHGQQISLSEHLAIVNDERIDVISRASALELMERTTPSLRSSQINPFVNHDEDLLRLAAARVGNLVEVKERMAILGPLLDDTLKSVRSAAAQALVGLPITQKNLALFTKAFNELTTANEASIWRGEGRINQGNNALKQNDVVSAEIAYKASIETDPYFSVGYINLADLYRAKQREDMVEKVLLNGIEALPDSADIAYAYGLQLVRIKNITKAIEYFKQAMLLDERNPQLAYTYALALDGNNQTQFAIDVLKRVVYAYPNNSSLVELGLYLSRKHNSKTDFDWFTQVNKQQP
jgi:predicted CXXCH cytochrome family protein